MAFHGSMKRLHIRGSAGWAPQKDGHHFPDVYLYFLEKKTRSLCHLCHTKQTLPPLPEKHQHNVTTPKKTWGSRQFLPPTSPAKTQISQSVDSLPTYCWWEESCNSWYGRHPTIYRVAYMSGGCLGFLPSTVFCGTWPHWKPSASEFPRSPRPSPPDFWETNPQATTPATPVGAKNRLKFVNMDGSPWRYLGSEAAVVSCGDREPGNCPQISEARRSHRIWEPGKLKLWKSPVKVAKKVNSVLITHQQDAPIDQQLYHAKQLYDFEIRIHPGTVLECWSWNFAYLNYPHWFSPPSLPCWFSPWPGGCAKPPPQS